MASNLKMDFVELKKDKILNEVKNRSEKGEDPVKILKQCQEGMEVVGNKFQKGEFFLAELILSSVIFKNAVSILKPYLLSRAAPQKKVGKVMVVTLKGDIHDLGKNIFADLIGAQDFDVLDLGVDQDPRVVVDRVREFKPDFLGFSALMTTSFPIMEETAKILGKEGLRNGFKLLVGGGVTTPAVGKLVGADLQTTDAMEGVNFCKNTLAGGK